ncbi:MAG TPA: multicopper oxidase domain-containing protein [Jatrophihabitans sp.]|nr:multicopper oxidase domain-containing protein [Jatrophihabitans sp.]
MTRRDVLRLATGAAVAAPLVALTGWPRSDADAAGMGGGGMGGGGMGGGGGVIDPPVGPLLVQPALLPNESNQPGVVQVSLTARQTAITANGTAANLLTYNGQFPGPVIRARRTDLLRVNFRNDLPNDSATNFLGHNVRITNLHTHGLHVSPSDNANGTHADNMMVMLDPGESTVYEYDLSRHRSGNLNFYHPHIHGNVTDQMWGGLSGPLLIDDEVTSLAPFQEKVLVLKDITLAGNVPAPHSSQMSYMHGLEGSVVFVNGQVNPRLTIAPGQVQRWRVVNACTARFFRLSLQSHAMYLVGTDGGLLDRPYRISEILLSPGERVDLLVKADQRGASYKWLSLPYDRGGMTTLQQVTLMTVTYSGSKVSQSVPTAVDPAAKRVTAATLGMDLAMLPRKQISLTMGHGGVGINGITYVDHEHCFMTMSSTGMWEIWDVSNASGMDHPFHHHTNAAQVLSITGGDAGYASLYTRIPAWKDVTIVPKGGSVQLLMPVLDYAGMAMLHCHIIEHEDIGMMGVWHIMSDMAG